jgi:hypothetical protein
VKARSDTAGIAVAAAFIVVLLIYRVMRRIPALKGLAAFTFVAQIALGAVLLWYAGLTILSVGAAFSK